MEAETKARHKRELDEAVAAAGSSEPVNKAGEETNASAGPGARADDGGGGDGGSKDGVDKIDEAVGAMSLEEREKHKRDQKRAKAQRKREKQREKVPTRTTAALPLLV